MGGSIEQKKIELVTSFIAAERVGYVLDKEHGEYRVLCPNLDIIDLHGVETLTGYQEEVLELINRHIIEASMDAVDMGTVLIAKATGYHIDKDVSQQEFVVSDQDGKGVGKFKYQEVSEMLQAINKNYTERKIDNVLKMQGLKTVDKKQQVAATKASTSDEYTLSICIEFRDESRTLWEGKCSSWNVRDGFLHLFDTETGRIQESFNLTDIFAYNIIKQET